MTSKMEKLNILISYYLNERRNAIYRRRKIYASVLAFMNLRKKLVAVLLALLNCHSNQVAIYSQPSSRVRTCRRFLRNGGWWNTVWDTYSVERFKYTFRTSRKTFTYILSFVSDKLQKEFITEEPLSPEMRLGLCLYKLGRRGLFIHYCRNVWCCPVDNL